MPCHALWLRRFFWRQSAGVVGRLNIAAPQTCRAGAPRRRWKQACGPLRARHCDRRSCCRVPCLPVPYRALAARLRLVSCFLRSTVLLLLLLSLLSSSYCLPTTLLSLSALQPATCNLLPQPRVYVCVHSSAACVSMSPEYRRTRPRLRRSGVCPPRHSTATSPLVSAVQQGCVVPNLASGYHFE